MPHRGCMHAATHALGRGYAIGRRRASTGALQGAPRRAAPALLAAAACVLSCATPALAGVRLSFFGGTAFQAPARLTVRQAGAEDLRFTAHYAAHPFTAPIYYAWRIAWWNAARPGAARGWALELVHHKVFVTNPPPEIERFSVSHGLNLVSAMRLWEVGRAHLFAGIGPVISHPESSIRGRVLEQRGGIFDAGYHWTGPQLSVGAGTSARVLGRAFVNVEARGAAARVRVPVAGGSARFTHLGLHLMLGIEIRP